MRGRVSLLAFAIVASVVGLLVWRSSPSAPAPPAVVIALAPDPSPPPPSPSPSESNQSVPISASVAPASLHVELDAETVLRQLEPLAVTDKPRALQLALAADSKLAPSGVMAEARRALIVTLLVDLDRIPEARGRARQFTARYASSSYVPLVQGVTGVHPRPSPSQLRDARAPRP